ncbi:MAG: IS66 family transposase zinc-finger binding domain-containing protein [Burkholderia sp.]
MHFGLKSGQLDRQIENLKTRLGDLTAGRGAVDVQHAKRRARTRPRAARNPIRWHHRCICCAKRSCSNPDPVCPKCGTEIPMLGEDVSEQLAHVAAAFKVIRTIQRKMLGPRSL